jgi:ubiquinone/menaquinone biosynthesis C-methylase UbiE
MGEDSPMGFYSRHIMPTVVSCGCSLPMITDLRRAVVPRASGVVLELGIGSGLNLALYDPAKVERIYGLEPDPAMLAKARRRTARSAVPVTVLAETAETVSLPDGSVDTVVVTFAMCTIPDVAAALSGARRVLKPGGRLLFCEHGKSPEPDVFRRQTQLDPLWGRIFGGCHLTRDIPALIGAAGFRIDDIEAGYMQPPSRRGGATARIGGYLYRGSASPPG